MDHTSKIVNISVNEEARKGSNPRRYTEKYRYKSTKVVYDIQVVQKKNEPIQLKQTTLLICIKRPPKWLRISGYSDVSQHRHIIHVFHNIVNNILSTILTL